MSRTTSIDYHLVMGVQLCVWFHRAKHAFLGLHKARKPCLAVKDELREQKVKKMIPGQFGG